MNATHNRPNGTRNLAAARLLAAPAAFCFLVLIVLPGCGGENAHQIRAEGEPGGTTAVAVSAPASSAPETAGALVLSAHEPTLHREKAPADTTKRNAAGTTVKKDSAATATTAGKTGTAATASEGSKAGEGNATAGGGCTEATPELVTQGRTVFIGRGNCISCHGANGKGNALGPDLTDDKWLHISGDIPSIADIVRKGVTLVVEHPSPMPAMGGSKLTDEQICAVSAYVWSLTHP